MATWTNRDGLKVNFNLDAAQKEAGGVTRVAKEARFSYDTQNPANSETAGNTSGREGMIPAGAYIKAAYLIVTEAFTSGGAATLTVGLAQDDGTVIDADGIDATIALSALNAVGEVVVCDGALVGGTVTIGTAAGFVYFTPATAAYTAGKAELVIEYVEV